MSTSLSLFGYPVQLAAKLACPLPIATKSWARPQRVRQQNMFMMRSELAFRLVVFATEYRSFEDRPRRRHMSHYGDSTTTDRTGGALSPVDRAAIGGRELL